MSRLLFAAARGARVQRQHEALKSRRTWWEDVPIQWGLDDELRIRPDDLHLQYGPISTALREYAEYETPIVSYSYVVHKIVLNYFDSIEYDENEVTRSLFLLILAEALADEGL